jgi:glycosyltransferase involved in cell wall biosynthesis
MNRSQQFRVGDIAPLPPLPRPEQDIIKEWPDGPPAVSVVCPTYNHASFIERAIHGFLCQETSFRLEVLIRDDASTDGTGEVVQNYASRYPSLIRPVLETQNRFPEVRPASVLRPLVRGRYIAYCEGDDYWIDPLKLQKQFDALEHNPGAVVSYHQTLVVENGIIRSLGQLPEEQCRDYSGAELTRGAWILSSSRLYRNVDFPVNPRSHPLTNGDRYLSAQLGLFGGALFEPDVTSVYRLHEGGIWSTLDATEKAISQATSFFLLGEQFGRQNQGKLKRYWYLKSMIRLARTLLNPRMLAPRMAQRTLAALGEKILQYRNSSLTDVRQ